MNKIEKALNCIEAHDWYWRMSDNFRTAEMEAKSEMKYFVNLVATIGNKVIENALRELWVATYKNIHANMFSHNEEATKAYNVAKSRLMAIIEPSMATAA